MTGRRRRSPTVQARHRIDVVIEPRNAAIWRRASASIAPRVRRAAAAALATAAGSKGGAALAIYLANDAIVRRLNHDFRGKNRPTNVLSFPAGRPSMATGVPAPLGDIVLAYETLAREAAQQGKKLLHHVLHLVVHGVLHLLGFDHEKARDAERMEALEVRILAGLGIADPYAMEMCA